MPISESSLSNRKENKKGQGHPWLFLRMNKLLPFLLSLFLLVSCSSAQEDVAIDIALMQEPPTLDVQVNSSISGKMIAVGNIFEKLVTMDDDGSIRTELASSFDLSDDGRHLEFTIRPDVIFHDGSAFAPDDACASLNRWLDVYPAADEAAGNNRFYVMDGKVCIDSERSLLMLLVMISSAPQSAVMMPEEVFGDGYVISEYIGTGPYMISEWYPGDYIELRKFDGYKPYATDKSSGPDTLRYIFVPDGTTRRLGLESGLYDAIDCVLSDDIPGLSANNGIRLLEGDESGTIALVLNKREGVFADIGMRRALSLLVDRDELMAACYGDYGYSVDSSYMEKESLWHSDTALDPYGTADEAAASSLLSSSYNGECVRILSSNTSNLDKIAIALSSELEQAGIDTEVIVLDWASFIEKRKDPSSWDIFISAYTKTALPQLKSYLSQSNPGWLDDGTALAMLDSLNDVSALDDAAALWQDAQLYLWNIVPAIIPGHYSTVYAVRSDLEGVALGEGFYFWNSSLSD